MIVLAIESTLDETGAAVAIRDDKTGGMVILSDVKASSAQIHAKYGGVIPEIAAREQISAIIPVITEAMDIAKIDKDRIDAIAVTCGPGMIGCLLMGVETAKVLAIAWKKPLIAVNHMAAHVFANYIVGEKIQKLPPAEASVLQHLRAGKNLKTRDNRIPELPAIALIVSGGHTDIVYLDNLVRWKWVGGTRDDAAGEAFDKAARAMGFPYPGGPLISKAGQAAKIELPTGFRLPRPMIHEDNLEMSFSGLKTALLGVISSPSFGKASEGSSREQMINALSREFNQAVADVLIKKTMMAVEQYNPKTVLLGGGVAANLTLREGLAKATKDRGIEFFCPELKYCTDNAAMIAACALMRPEYTDPLSLKPDPNLAVV